MKPPEQIGSRTCPSQEVGGGGGEGGKEESISIVEGTYKKELN